MSHQSATRPVAGVLLVTLVLGCFAGRLSSALLTSNGSGQTEQQEAAEELSSEAQKPGIGILQRRLCDEKPTRAWLVLREPRTRAPCLRLETLVHEDPRHVLLPRRTAPPSDDPT